MDSLQFDYASYSDSSAPRTPSPRSSVSSDGVPSIEDVQPYQHQQHSPAQHYKPSFDLDPLRNILADQARDDHLLVPSEQQQQEAQRAWATAQPPLVYGADRVSLMSDVYEHDMPHPHGVAQDMYLSSQSAEPYHGSEWSHLPPPTHALEHQQTLPPMRGSPPEYGMVRRNTFPYVRQDRAEQFLPHPQDVPLMDEHNGPMLGQQIYGEPMPMHGSPHMLSTEPTALHEPYMGGSLHSSPHQHYIEPRFDDSVKLEEPSPVIVPSQPAFYRGPPQHGMPISYLSPQTGLPVQYTDDAASKETQYLRRRCYNCHTTEPPSWRRSTLNPGKIVCNKCGLYERTHLRPRPLRFDELRAGNKSRKSSKGSPKARPIKKEPRDFGVESLSRRSSVSSNTSSSSACGASSDWDDSVSVHSSASSSAPTSGYPSPSQPAFSVPRDPHSSSPPMLPREGGIRLPGTPMAEIASLQDASGPRRANTGYYPPPFDGRDVSPTADLYARRQNSLPLDAKPRGVEMTGWQAVPLQEAPVTESPQSAHRSVVAAV